MQAAPEAQPKAIKILSVEEQKEENAKFEKILNSTLDKILDKRPTYPVTKFAK